MTTLTRLTVLVGLLALTACETMEGAGRDLENAGRTLSQESREVQRGY
ncbi:Entericidin EcnA/B family protein [Tranquillimonas rosea]|uniref:Entericidin EcnA/B family protein n=1 Tax=Tranquillimonas rosea TaxID=641238 RepID=A0A1H9X9V3_9RHOB|nr:entericidin A/B family lipoprotein [Tranquillimonas rosea]SES42433.1 Entericidin EcnA/B family protein [Tranquillimonas rosea]